MLRMSTQQPQQQQQQNSATLKSQQQQQNQQQTINNPPINNVNNVIGGDNIITISTASLNECTINGPCDQYEEIKLSKPSQQNPNSVEEATLTPTATIGTGTAKRIVHFLTKQSLNTTTPTDAQSTNTNTNSITIANANANQIEINDSKSCCNFNLSQFISSQDNIADVHHRKGRRLHGLQLPLHPLQLFGWLVLILFGLAAYFVLIPSFTPIVQGSLYGLISGLYIVHIVSHITALLLDPADRELRRLHRNDRIVPEFDRNKHSHVIENGRCHLCNIRTSSQRTKHCSVCNKCVGKFDHHCKWLNHCIGSRNYVAFLMCVVSAVIATLVIVAAVIAQVTFYFIKPEWLSFWQSNVTNVNVTTTATTDNLLPEDGTVAFVINTNFNGSFIGTSTNISLDGIASLSNVTNASVLQAENSTTTYPIFLDDITTLLVDHLNETLNTTIDDITATTNSNVLEANNTIATIAGIGISDTVFLIIIGFLGLLAAITAGLLLHLCFFHIYISFLGLTTYEYIRNHRQAQEAKAKSLLSSLPNSNQQPTTTITTTSTTTTTAGLLTKSPSKKTNNIYSQIYFCSSLRHPNSLKPNELRYFDARKPMLAPPPLLPPSNEYSSCTNLHCCTNSREYNQTASIKTYYMCSLLEEQPTSALSSPLDISHISGGGGGGGGNYFNDSQQSEESEDELQGFKTFHCCSSFAATTTQRRVSAASTKATLVTADTSANSRRAFTQFTEQCTFCSFRIRSPLVRKRNLNSANASIRTYSGQRQCADSQSNSRTTKTPSGSLHSSNNANEHQRCCMKAISKHQRWRKKWNCCVSVPDSPDVPNDIIAALAMRHQHNTTTTSATIATNKKINATEIPVQFIKTVDGSEGDYDTNSIPSNSAKSNTTQRACIRNNARTWPVARLRHMLRLLNRQRRPHPTCRHHNTIGARVDEQIKQNQIRPLQLQMSNNDKNGSCHHHHHHHHHHHQQQQQQHQQLQHYQQTYYDSSSPQPPSSTTTERSSEPSLYSDSSSTLPTPTCNTIETILPTSVIRDDTSVTYTIPIVGITLPPALPPPTRRKMPNPTDLEELAESLGFATSHQGGGIAGTLSPLNTQRLPALNNVYRRQRRKHFLRTRSPTLSPIHESGLSNPTSPQPCRHNANYTTNAAAITDSTETVRKTSSNSSLHSVSSNSSST